MACDGASFGAGGVIMARPWRLGFGAEGVTSPPDGASRDSGGAISGERDA